MACVEIRIDPAEGDEDESPTSYPLREFVCYSEDERFSSYSIHSAIKMPESSSRRSSARCDNLPVDEDAIIAEGLQHQDAKEEEESHETDPALPKNKALEAEEEWSPPPRTIYAEQRCPKCKEGLLKRRIGVGILFHLCGLPLFIFGVASLILCWVEHSSPFRPILGIGLLYVGFMLEASALCCSKKKCSECSTIYPVLFATYDDRCQVCQEGMVASRTNSIIRLIFGFLLLPMCCFGLFCFDFKKRCYDCGALNYQGMPAEV